MQQLILGIGNAIYWVMESYSLSSDNPIIFQTQHEAEVHDKEQ